MQNALNRLREIWQNTSKANQTLLVAIVGVAALVGIGFLYWASSPDYQTLVSNASPANAGRITALLDQKKINYRIVNEGTIQVPAAEAARLRMSLATEGLLEANTGGEQILAQTGPMTTADIEQENIRRAHEAELEKSIRTLDPVSNARVHLAAGSQDAFVDPEKKEASASIIVHLKPGHELAKDNVNAIVSLVQSAYTNLNRKNINLVDGDGHLLFNGAEMSSGLASVDDRQSMERSRATELTSLIRQQLAPALGADKFQVAVRVRLNLDRESEQKRTPTPGVKLSTVGTDETLTGSQLSVQRPPSGTAPNLGGAPGNPTVTPPAGGPGGTTTYSQITGQDGNPGKYSKNDSSTTYQVGETVTSVVKAAGEAKTVSVSVLLDSDKVSQAQADTIQAQVDNLVKGETDVAQANVKVDRFKFDNSAVLKEKQEQDVAAATERKNRILGYAVPFGLMLIMLAILARSLRRHVPKSGQLALGGSGGIGGVPGIGGMAGLGGLQPALAGAGYAGGYAAGGGLNMLVGEEGGLVPGMSVEDALDAEGKIIPIRQGETIHTYEVITEQFDSNLESILHLARSKPEMVARLVKSWIVEDQTRKM